MPPDLTSLWAALSSILTLLVAISQATKEFGYVVRYQKSAQNDNPTAQTRMIDLLKIEQREPSNRPPKLLSLAPLVSSILMLSFGIGVTYMMITGTIEFQIDFWTVLLAVVFIGLPVYVIIDYFHTESEYYKLGRSKVAKEAKVTVLDDVDTVFGACYRALDSMQAAIIILEKPNLLKAKSRNCVMTVTIVPVEGSEVKVYILSDSNWLTIKWDRGANKRNVDDFLHELRKQSSLQLPNFSS